MTASISDQRGTMYTEQDRQCHGHASWGKEALQETNHLPSTVSNDLVLLVRRQTESKTRTWKHNLQKNLTPAEEFRAQVQRVAVE